MTSYEVFLVSDAEEDLFSIYKFYFRNNMVSRGLEIVSELKDLCLSLQTFAARGHCPRELERVGILEYKELSHANYRIIYQIIEDQVFIHAILDGRRDLQSLLEMRLIRADV